MLVLVRRFNFVLLVVFVVYIQTCCARINEHDRYQVNEETKTQDHVNHSNATHNDSSASASAEEQDIGQGFFGDEDDDQNEEIDKGDSSVSEERNPEDFINSELTAVKLEGDHDRPETISVIANAFNNKKSFSCPKIKSDFVTGTSVADLSPEDVGIIGALGDSLATGTGLWPRTQIEFRGAAFPTGGDATIDGLITIPNILREFRHNEIAGVSHGMGSRDQLPDHQLNVATAGATSSSMPEQAHELVRRLSVLKEIDVYNTWALIIITIGTEEVCFRMMICNDFLKICSNCTVPDTDALIETIDILNRGIHKAVVILLGPIHVSSSYHQKANLLKTRCACSKDQSNEFMISLSEKWSTAFAEVQAHSDRYKRKHFGLLTLPMLTVTSRYPYSLFLPNQPLWNRLIAGPKYNLTNAVLSQDSYYCPSISCPYFRLPENYAYCKILRHVDVEAMEQEADQLLTKRTKYNVYLSAAMIIFIAFIAVIIAGTFFYFRSKMGNRPRFDPIPDRLVFKHRATTIRKPSIHSITSQKEDMKPRLRPTAPSLDISTPIIHEESSEE
ncbi:Phospholipase B1, membrane-associated [Aphelenchoides besseyi]|nr:Phospholipase B1, membrane-associated [Aphelenchoides besseyi]